MKIYMAITAFIALIIGGIYLVLPDKTLYHMDVIYAIAVWLFVLGVIVEHIQERRARKERKKGENNG